MSFTNFKQRLTPSLVIIGLKVLINEFITAAKENQVVERGWPI